MTAKILVVDDEPDLEVLVNQRFRRDIRSGDYDFSFAHDGAEALEMLQTNTDIDMVLSDINMPRMDGLTLLGHLSQVNPLLRAVIVSAYGDMENIRTAMNLGAFDFVTKPIDFKDLRVTIDKTLSELAILRDALDKRFAAERARANLSRYFAPSLVETLADTDEPFGPARKQNVTILFADIVGFTALSADKSPEAVFELLRDLLSHMAGAVFEAGGTLDKYIGDGLMATFGTPTQGSQDASDAVRCAFAMQAAIDDINRARTDVGEGSLRVAIGVHHGPVLMGNIGEERRLEFAVIGDTVNVASRLEALARPLNTRIVVSEAVIDAIRWENPEGIAELDLLHQRGVQPVRGLNKGVMVWTLDEPSTKIGA
jgi:adenylate cyclase